MESLAALARAVGADDEAKLARIDERVRAWGLDAGASVPAWLVEGTRGLAAGRATDGWVPFARGDASEAMELVRELPSLLPVAVVDEGETLAIAVPTLGNQLVVTFEGAAWWVGAIDAEPPG